MGSNNDANATRHQAPLNLSNMIHNSTHAQNQSRNGIPSVPSHGSTTTSNPNPNAPVNLMDQLERPNNLEQFNPVNERTVETTLGNILPPNTLEEEEVKSRPLVEGSSNSSSSSSSGLGGQVNTGVGVTHDGSSSSGGSTADTTPKPSVEVAPIIRDTTYLTENIVDKNKIAGIRRDLVRAAGSSTRAISKISDDACGLLSEAIQLHAVNIMEQCSTLSRRRRHSSLKSSYTHVSNSLIYGRGIPQNDTRNNLALKFGVDTRALLVSEELNVRSVIKDRTKAWEAEILETMKRESEREHKTTGRRRTTVDDMGPTVSELRWASDVSNIVLPMYICVY